MQNAGDAAQLEAIILNLQTHFHEPKICVATNHPGEIELQNLNIKIIPSVTSLIGAGKEISGISKILRFIKALLYLAFSFLSRKAMRNLETSSNDWKGLLHAYHNADLIISVSGNIFFTMGRIGFPFLCSSLAIIPAFIYGKPFYVLPQSIGPLERLWERVILKTLYQRANLIFLREPASYRLAEQLKFPMDRVRLALDPTIEIRETSEEEIPIKLQEAGYTIGRVSLGVTVIPRMVKSLPESMLDHYYQALAGSLADFVLNLGTDIYFFPQVSGPTAHEDDRNAFQEVTSIMVCPIKHIKIIKDRLSPDALRHLYQRMDLFLASRLHSGLFAMSYGIPTLMIGYMSKAQGIMELLNLEDWLLDITELDQQVLTRKLESIWQQRIHVSLQIRQNILDVLKRSPDPGSEIMKDFYHGLR
jgi:colanic acid/amylovoran biosynthesis protein